MFSCLQDLLICPLVTASSVDMPRERYTSITLGLSLNWSRSSEKNCGSSDGDDMVLNEELAFQSVTVYTDGWDIVLVITFLKSTSSC
jgi:hypothetical protein